MLCHAKLQASDRTKARGVAALASHVQLAGEKRLIRTYNLESIYGLGEILGRSVSRHTITKGPGRSQRLGLLLKPVAWARILKKEGTGWHGPMPRASRWQLQHKLLPVYQIRCLRTAASSPKGSVPASSRCAQVRGPGHPCYERGCLRRGPRRLSDDGSLMGVDAFPQDLMRL